MSAMWLWTAAALQEAIESAPVVVVLAEAVCLVEVVVVEDIFLEEVVLE